MTVPRYSSFDADVAGRMLELEVQHMLELRQLWRELFRNPLHSTLA